MSRAGGRRPELFWWTRSTSESRKLLSPHYNTTTYAAQRHLTPHQLLPSCSQTPGSDPKFATMAKSNQGVGVGFMDASEQAMSQLSMHLLTQDPVLIRDCAARLKEHPNKPLLRQYQTIFGTVFDVSATAIWDTTTDWFENWEYDYPGAYHPPDYQIFVSFAPTSKRVIRVEHVPHFINPEMIVEAVNQTGLTVTGWEELDEHPELSDSGPIEVLADMFPSMPVPRDIYIEVDGAVEVLGELLSKGVSVSPFQFKCREQYPDAEWQTRGVSEFRHDLQEEIIRQIYSDIGRNPPKCPKRPLCRDKATWTVGLEPAQVHQATSTEEVQPPLSKSADAPTSPKRKRPPKQRRTLNPPTPGTQCFRCQGWGHVARHCSQPEKCRKCAQGHRTSACPGRPRRCANCDGDHQSSSVRCQFHPAHQHPPDQQARTSSPLSSYVTPHGSPIVPTKPPSQANPGISFWAELAGLLSKYTISC